VAEQSSRTGRAVVISASVGAGHDAAADEIVRRLRGEGMEVQRHDFLDLMPGKTGKLICGSYHQMLSLAPWSYRFLYGTLDRFSALSLQVALLSMLTARRMRAAIPEDACVIVSTYPLASQTLGRLRRSRRLEIPVVTYLTDFSVHRLWIAPGVDAHVAIHDVPAGQARRHHAAAVATAVPVVDPRFTPGGSRDRAAARERHSLPSSGSIALLVGGSWGAGDLEEAVRDIEATGLATCAVVCGRNEGLRSRLHATGIRHVFGWVDDMPGLMHAADVLVQNAGGMTVLEAVASALPVVTYRCIPGHGVTNAAALDEAGVAPWARTTGELAAILGEALTGPTSAAPDRAWCAADPIEVVLGTARASTGIRRAPLRITLIPMQRNRRARAGSSGRVRFGRSGTDDYLKEAA
jgi:UDP-N-acetylglucosamine:LPS N-acetylglucosamine transferase